MIASEPGIRVGLVDDDDDLRAATAQTLSLAGFAVDAFSGAEAALAVVRADWPGIVVTDVRMPRVDGITLFREVRRRDPELPVLLITAHGDVAMAVDALKNGAWDFLSKPFDPDALVAAVRRAVEARALALDNRRLRALAQAGFDSALVGQSPAIVQLRQTIAVLADADIDVCVEGETGTGKELVARLIHRGGKRARHPFAAIACAALPEALVDAELIGDASGRPGRVLEANRGTLFLDNVDQAGPALQARLAQLLEDRQLRTPGSRDPQPLDVRVVSATETPLDALVAEGRFSAVLLFRLCGVRLRVPPLRERREDVPLLFAHLLDAAAARLRRPPPPLTPGVRRMLLEHAWPGNVRELAHYVEQVMLGIADAGAEAADAGNLPERVGEYEATLLREAFLAEGGDVARTLVRLGIPRKTFYYKVNRYGIDLNELRLMAR